MLERIASKLPRLRIYAGGQPYLDRHYVAGPAPSTGFPAGMRLRWRWLPFTVYLHRFWRGDSDRDLHNHPWTAVSLILAGGYLEEVRVGDTIRKRILGPGHLNIIRKNRFHRIDLIAGSQTWTLVAHGKRTQVWGFWDQTSGKFIPHTEYLA